ncbi:hypothetical protein V3C99_008915 [Haemonchus contortus]
MRISVKTLSGETDTFEVEPSLSIRNVKILLNVHNKLVKGTWCPPNEHRLIFAGRQLDENHTLTSYGIQNDGVLHVVLRCHGGGEAVALASPHPSNNKQEAIERLLTCCICYERYKQPKILPCQHSFCLQCLEMCLKYRLISQSGRLKCPACRAEHLVPPGGVQSFPSNHTLIDFLNKPSLFTKYTASEIEQLQNYGGMQIFVRTFTGKTITLDVLPSYSIEMIRNEIYNREGIQPAHQRLICNGKELQNGYALSFYKIQRWSTIELVGRCVGGNF